MTRIFFDTEFIENGKTILPLSLGAVTENGRHCFYAVFTDTDREQAGWWVRKHVFPYLDPDPVCPSDCTLTFVRGTREEIAVAFQAWCEALCPPEELEFYADHAAYDWVLLGQMYGTMIDLPKGWPMWVHDLKQCYADRGAVKLSKPEVPHNALSDAFNVRLNWLALADSNQSELYAHLNQ